MPEPSRRGRNLQAYRRKAQRVTRNGSVCWLCGEAIDPNLHYLNPLAGVADHVDPIAHGGDILGELRAAHRQCNLERGTKPPPPIRNSRDW